jgi:hypothetical protein
LFVEQKCLFSCNISFIANCPSAVGIQYLPKLKVVQKLFSNVLIVLMLYLELIFDELIEALGFFHVFNYGTVISRSKPASVSPYIYDVAFCRM